MKKKPNIYHIVLDGFNSLVFMQALKDLKMVEAFNGFTFFKKNRANYNDTFASMASILNGSFFKDGSFKRWNRKKFNSGMLMKMNQHGYQINNYNVDKKFSFNNASLQKFQEDLLDKYISSSSHSSKILKAYNGFVNDYLSERIGKGTRLMLSKSLTPFKIWLKSSNGFPSFPIERFILSEFILSLPMMLDFVYNEKKINASGQYNFIHIMLPHSPYNWTRSFTSGESNYMEQVYCTINLMVLFINELKKFGRFKDSLIIFHSDHGWSEFDLDYPFLSKTPEKILQKIQTTTNHDPSRFLHRTHSLLLIKPPGSDSMKPFEVSDRLTQLIDIPSTISHLTGLEIIAKDGCSVFSNIKESNKEIHMYAGLHKYNKLGLKCVFGKHFLKGSLAHFSINQENEWKIYPDVPISWN